MASAVPQPKARKSLHIAVLLEGVQLSDIVGIDIFGNLSLEYVRMCTQLDPALAAFEPHAIEDFKVYYPGQTLELPGELTAQFKYQPNCTYDDCPRDLDLVIVGGNIPSFRPEPATRFIREAWARTRVWMTTCTGALWVADSVDLTGKRVTTNRMFLGGARSAHPEVAEWCDQRWVVDSKPYDGEGDGELWTSGGAGAGIDMIADYCLKNFDTTFVNLVCLYGLEFQPGRSLGQSYNYDPKQLAAAASQ